MYYCRLLLGGGFGELTKEMTYVSFGVGGQRKDKVECLIPLFGARNRSSLVTNEKTRAQQ